MLSQEAFFPCPSCGEIIGSNATRCKYCNTDIDPHAAQAAANVQLEVNQACNDASMARNVASVMWVAFAVQFLFAAMGRLAFIGMMAAVPLMLIRWQSRYGRLKTSDRLQDRAAKSNHRLAPVVANAVRSRLGSFYLRGSFITIGQYNKSGMKDEVKDRFLRSRESLD
jgi:hypothetical protein